MQYTRTGVTEVYPTLATTNTCSTPGQELQKYILLQPQQIHAAHQDRSYRSISYSSHNKYMQYTRTGVTEVYPTLATTNTCSTPGQELQKYILLQPQQIHAAHQDRSYRSISYSSHNKYMQHTRTGVTEVYPTPATTNTCSTPGQELQKYILLQPQQIHAVHQDRSYTRTGVTEVYPTLATTNTCSTPG